MKNLAEILRAVMAALGRLVSKTVVVAKWVGGRMVQVAQTVTERVFDTAIAAPRAVLDITGATLKLGAGAVSDVVKAPFRLAGALLGGGRKPQQTAQSAAAAEANAQRAAAQQEADRQAVADRQADARELVQTVRNVAAARARGEWVDDVTLGRLPESVRDYLLALDRKESGVIAAASVMGLRNVLKGRAPEGVRSPADIREAAGAEVVPEAEVAARRAEVRAAAKAAMRGTKEPKDDVDSIMRSLTA